MIADIFRDRVQTRATLVVEKPGDVESVWKNLKGCLIEEAVEVCEKTKGIRILT